MPERKLTNIEKAAILLRVLGEESAARILGNLSDSEIRKVAIQLGKMDRISREMVDSVIEEFNRMISMEEGQLDGGKGYVRRVLGGIPNRGKVEPIIQEIASSIERERIERLRELDPKTLASLCRKEHPQTVALLLVHLDPSVAAKVIPLLPEGIQADVVVRMCRLERVDPSVMDEVAEVLLGQIPHLERKGDEGSAGGVAWVASLMNRTDRLTEQRILAQIAEQNPSLEEEIKRRMFIFEDLLKVDNRGIQEILKEVTTQQLAKALKTASEELQEKIYRNMSERSTEMLKEEIELLGPIRLSEVEAAQGEIMAVANRLKGEGKVIVEGGEDVLV